MWQEVCQLPVLVGLDANITSTTLLKSEFWGRSPLQVVSPREPARTNSRSASTIDYMLCSRCLGAQVESCDVLRDFPLAPHSLVRLRRHVDAVKCVPVLRMPTRLPLIPPIGPAPEPQSWQPLADGVEAALRWFDDEELDQQGMLRTLDEVYQDFAKRFEDHLCSIPDTPKRRRSGRAQAPSLKLVTAKDRAQRHYKSWSSLVRPLHWLRCWTQDVISYITAVGENASSAMHLHEELLNSPAEFQEKPILIGLYARAKDLVHYMMIDENAGFTVPTVNEAAFRDLLSAISDTMQEEQRRQKQELKEAWADWVRDSQAHRKGWAHKWTAIQQNWRPLVAQHGFSGRPLDILMEESQRLQHIWGCREERAGWFEAPRDAWRELPPIDVADFLKAAATFPCRSAQTWDGFHPRHYGLLREDQCRVVIRLYQLVERTGCMPSTAQGIFGKMIPKHKPGMTRVSMRSIGLLPSLYRHWQRVRQPVARSWEARNKCPQLGHQAGRSIMETVFIQSLRSEATQTPDAAGRRAHSAAFLWDLSDYYEFVNHEKLYERAGRRGMNLAVVSIALNQYRSKRFLGLGDVACYAHYPARGLAAGCGWATTWVQVYTLEPLLVWQESSPQVGLTVFFDDLMGEATAEEEHLVVGRLTAGAASLQTSIEVDLKCEVAAHKSVLVASSDKLLQKLRAAFGRFGGQASQSAPNLGVDYFAGRRRARKSSTRTLRGRQAKLLKRCRRLHSLKRAGYNMRELFVTGLQQASLYGAEVNGLDSKELKAARASFLTLVGSQAASASTALTLAVTGDPLWRQALGPALTWSTIVWKSATSKAFQAVVDIPRLGQMAAPALQRLPGRRGESRAP